MPTLKDIAKNLIAKHQLKQRDADAFVSAIVETILEGLNSDRQVKIKGFGTFKLTAVRDRESVNVNTGERVVISGHDKISFTPDVVMRDMVNKPFAQFETVILADGVSFDDMEMDAESEDVTQDVTPETSMQVEENQQPADAVASAAQDDIKQEQVQQPVVIYPQNESESKSVIVETEPESKNEIKPVVIEPEPVMGTVVIEPLVKQDVKEEEMPEQQQETVENEQPEGVSEKLNNAEKATMDCVVSDVVTHSSTGDDDCQDEACDDGNREDENNVYDDDDDSKYMTYDEVNECKNTFVLYALVVNIIVAACAFVLGYLCCSYNWLGLRNDDSPYEEYIAEEDEDTTAVVPEAEDTIKDIATLALAEQKRKEQQEAEHVEKKDVQQKAVVSSQDNDIYKKDARVRTGAYNIIGTETTVKVRAGQTLRSISKTYLGDGMECYVEVYNGGITEVSEGQTIKIPKLQLKKKTLSN